MWNVLVTARRGQERFLLRSLSLYGEFKGSGFRDVVVGRVQDVRAFLESLENLRKAAPAKFRNFSQIVPLENNFKFDTPDFVAKAKEAISPLIERLENKKFHVRVKRRGHKGEISGQAAEKELADFVFDFLEKTGKQAEVTFANPDSILIIETIGNWAGVGLITKDLKESFPLVRME